MKRRIDEPNKCQCNFCRTYDRYVWAQVLECGCGCHKEVDANPCGHESLCCEFPNGRISDNPYDDLRPLSDYKKILILEDRRDNIYPIERMTMDDDEYATLSNEIESLIKEFGI